MTRTPDTYDEYAPAYSRNLNRLLAGTEVNLGYFEAVEWTVTVAKVGTVSVGIDSRGIFAAVEIVDTYGQTWTLYQNGTVEDQQGVIVGRHDVRLATGPVPDQRECEDCHEMNHPSASVCEGCGSRLYPSNQTASAATSLDGMSAADAEGGVSVVKVDGCMCGGHGICTACELARLDGAVV